VGTYVEIYPQPFSMTEELATLIVPLEFRFSLAKELMSNEEIADHFHISEDEALLSISHYQTLLDADMLTKCASHLPAVQACPLIRSRRAVAFIVGAVAAGIGIVALAIFGAVTLYKNGTGSDDSASVQTALKEQQGEIEVLRDSLNDQIAHNQMQDRSAPTRTPILNQISIFYSPVRLSLPA
jgi:hypothetical protein